MIKRETIETVRERERELQLKEKRSFVQHSDTGMFRKKNNLNRGIKVAFICDSLKDRNKA